MNLCCIVNKYKKIKCQMASLLFLKMVSAALLTKLLNVSNITIINAPYWALLLPQENKLAY